MDESKLKQHFLRFFSEISSYKFLSFIHTWTENKLEKYPIFYTWFGSSPIKRQHHKEIKKWTDFEKLNRNISGSFITKNDAVFPSNLRHLSKVYRIWKINDHLFDWLHPPQKYWCHEINWKRSVRVSGSYVVYKSIKVAPSGLLYSYIRFPKVVLIPPECDTIKSQCDMSVLCSRHSNSCSLEDSCCNLRKVRAIRIGDIGWEVFNILKLDWLDGAMFFDSNAR